MNIHLSWPVLTGILWLALSSTLGGTPSLTPQSPAANAQAIGDSVTLSVNVTGAVAPAQVTFFGRKTTPPVPGADFVVAAIPDPQHYFTDATQTLGWIYHAQTAWFVNNRVPLNIAFISHMGDFVEVYNIEDMWQNADAALSNIEDPTTVRLPWGIPWGGAPGNHDLANFTPTGDDSFFNRYFGINRFQGRGYYRGNYGTKNNNSYAFFTAGGLDFIVIHLQYRTWYETTGERDVLNWADALLKANPDRRAIVTSHWLLGTGNPGQFGGPGARVYAELKDNPNLFLMLCGHIHGEGRRTDVFEGRSVHTVLQDYQEDDNGGDGWLRYFVFSPANNTIQAFTYSPTRNGGAGQFRTGSSSQFTLPYNMQLPVMNWVPLGTATVQGGSASVSWTGLNPESHYEWYTVATDSTGSQTAQSRRFATAPAQPPGISLSASSPVAAIPFPASLEITANTTVGKHPIARVEFYEGSIRIATDQTPPYSATWQSDAPGSYAIAAVAVDSSGQATLSPNLNINVTAPVSSQGVFLFENFDSMGRNGTVPPAGWLIKTASDGTGATWTTTIPATGQISVATLGEPSSGLVATDAPTGSNLNGWNAAIAGDPTNRTIATAPTSRAGTAIQLRLLNTTATPIQRIGVSYETRRLNASTSPNELPGYWLFYSADGGLSWINVAALNPSVSGTGSVMVPNTAGTTSVPAHEFPINGGWMPGAPLFLRWVDDNANNFTDQILGLDNVTVYSVGSSSGQPPVNQAPESQITSPATDLTITAGATIEFKSVGADPDNNVPLGYYWQFGTGSGLPDSVLQNPGILRFNNPGTFTVTLAVSDSLGLIDSTPDRRIITVLPAAGGAGPTIIPQTGWKLRLVDSEETVREDGRAINAFDGNPATFWHSRWSVTTPPPPPHEIQIDIGSSRNISGFTYLPRQDGSSNGRIGRYEFYVSSDGVAWGPAVASGTFANSAQQQIVTFASKAGRFIRLRALSEINDRAWTCVAEIGLLETGVVAAPAPNLAPDGDIIQPLGNITVTAGSSITFAGSGIDPDGNLPLNFSWVFGEGVTPASASTQNPGAVRFDNPGIYVVSMVVSDSLGLSDPTPAERTITVNPAPGATTAPVSKTGWKLQFVDSEETSREDGRAINAFDGNPNSFWHTQWSSANPPPPHEIRIDTGAVRMINGFSYLPRQDGSSNGRVGQFEFYVSVDGNTWGSPVSAGVFSNNNELQSRSFTAKIGRYVRFRALTEVNSRAWTCVAEIGLTELIAINLPPDSVITAPTGNVTIPAGSNIQFTGFGSDPEGQTPLNYAWTFGTGSGLPDLAIQNPGALRFDNPGTHVVRFTVSDPFGLADPTPAERVITVTPVPGSTLTPIPQTEWKLHFVDSEETAREDGRAINAFDGNSSTFWHTPWSTANPPPPHEIQIDLGSSRNVAGFSYMPRQDGSNNGRIAQFEFYVSADGINWGSPVVSGTFANSNQLQSRTFTPRMGRFVRLRALGEIESRPWTCVAEISVAESIAAP